MAATNLVPLITLLFLLDVYELIHRDRSLNFSQDSRSTFARKILTYANGYQPNLRESMRSSNLMSASGIRFVGMLGEWIIDLYLELRVVKRRVFSAAVKYTVNRMSTFIIQ